MKTKAQVIHCRMVEKLRPDELEAFKEAFDMFDRNMDGTISTKVGHKNGNCDNNDDKNHDLYIIGAVCGSRKMITSSWESPVTT